MRKPMALAPALSVPHSCTSEIIDRRPSNAEQMNSGEATGRAISAAISNGAFRQSQRAKSLVIQRAAAAGFLTHAAEFRAWRAKSHGAPLAVGGVGQRCVTDCKNMHKKNV